MWSHFVSTFVVNCSSPGSSHAFSSPIIFTGKHRDNTSPKNRQHGFTLVEILVSIGIVGILAGVAIPNYMSFTKNRDISGALASLMNATTQMEKEFIDRNNYSCDAMQVASKNYVFSCSLNNGYLITASSSDNNYVYTINQNGTRKTLKFDGNTISNSNNCWKTSENGCY